MGRRGPQPVPIEVHRARGCSQQYARKGEPPVLPDPPEMPAWIAGNADAVCYWGVMKNRLSPVGLWSEQFTEALAILCVTYADYLGARRRVRGALADWMKSEREFRTE